MHNLEHPDTTGREAINQAFYDWRAGWEEGGEKIIEAHRGFVVQDAMHYDDYLRDHGPCAIETEDLILAGEQAILKAAEGYDPDNEFNATFLAFAGSRIHGAITDEFYNMRGATRPTHHIHPLINGFAKAEGIEQMAGERMSDAALAVYLEYEQGRVIDADGNAIALTSEETYNVPSLRMIMRAMRATSLEKVQAHDAEIEGGFIDANSEPYTEPTWESGLLIDRPIAAIPTADELFDVVAVRAALAIVYQEIDQETPRQKRNRELELLVLKRLYGLDIDTPNDVGQPADFIELGQDLGISRQGVHFIHRRALNRLRPYLEETTDDTVRHQEERAET
ncbi:MAG TPA: hypothetical protein VJP80_02330 [Candidatus Saccharimonadales bacterium]|nr:hypothetical protein [Candidatus Saccharimonadales bacterium]